MDDNAQYNHHSKMEDQKTRREANHSLPDLSYLNDLSDGDESFVNEVLTLFTEETPQSLKSLMVYHKTGNFTLLKVTVHKMKSSLKMMGNDELSDMAQEIENNAQETSKYPLIVSQLPPFITQVNKFLEGLLIELKRRNA